MTTPRILAIDPGMSAGICFGELGTKDPKFSPLILPGIHYGGRFATMLDRLMFLIKGNGITHVFHEMPFVNLHPRPAKKGGKDFTVNVQQLHLGFGYKAIIETACHKCDISEPVGVTSMQWRSPLFDKAKPPQGMNEAQRRKWWKSKAIERCVEKGFNISSDDIAEAVCLWEYGCGTLDVNIAVQSTPLFGDMIL